jgi:DNA-binding transcriptional ArsR family regulator
MGNKYVFEEITDTLKPDDIKDPPKTIEITEKGKKPQREVEFILDDERAKILDDPVRLQILQILREGIEDTHTTEEYNEETGERIIRQRTVRRNIMSVVEIVKMSPECEGCEKLTKNQIYHHLPKLEEHGYIIKYAVVTTGGRSTDYYRRTANGFVLTTGLEKMDKKTVEKKSTEFIKRLTQVFDIDITDEQQQAVAELQMKIMGHEYENRRRIAELVRGDVADDEVLHIYEWLVHLYTIGNNEYVNAQKKIREILFPNV